MVIHPAARAAVSLFTQSVSFSATLPSVHPFRHPVIHSARHPSNHPTARLSGCPAV
ncbi:conserved domain protein [Phocaeicola vulgatus PC510]|uniref:Conserved domain protein n=1 Tax=Phocaeicola vulgatus PC510 TaxID=702446 RepID=D4V5N2_PHOVU|nr:conserved domain protein [Phocaeicola vulgatus PC510]